MTKSATELFMYLQQKDITNKYTVNYHQYYNCLHPLLICIILCLIQGWAGGQHVQGQGQGQWFSRPRPRPVTIKYKVKAKIVLQRCQDRGQHSFSVIIIIHSKSHTSCPLKVGLFCSLSTNTNMLQSQVVATF